MCAAGNGSPSGRPHTTWDIRLLSKATYLVTTFRELGVLPEICDALERAGITTPFAIQEMTLSVALMGTDLIGQARTGTGKTLAFGIPVLQRSVAPHDPAYADLPQGKPQALIVAPTRELALQVSGDLALASKDLGLRVLTVYGGVGYDTQLDALETGVDVVVGTPGPAHRPGQPPGARPLPRARAGARRGRRDARPRLPARRGARCCRKTPETRQTMLFSATMPAAIVGAGPHPHAPPDEHPRRVVRTTPRWCPATAQFIYQAHDLDKPEIIGRILQAEDAEKIIVFTRTKRQAQRVADDLAERGFAASPLHGDMAQVAREKALAKFREDKIRVLVAHRRRRPRHRRARRLPRHQLHLPRGRQDLRPPHRPHRPRRRHRHRDHLRRLGRPAPAGR